jgi:hypothetical protein
VFHRIQRHVRANVIAYLALVLAVGGGSGYAIAASRTTTIHGCVVKRTGELLIKKRCRRGQARLLFNQRGPIGPKGDSGAPGQTGPAGAPAPSAWAVVAGDGVSQPDQTHDIIATRTSAGTYQLTATAPACVQANNSPIVSVSDAYPPAGQLAGAFPVGWVENGPANQFTVLTGDVVNGVFTPSDHTFNVQDVCGS